MLLQLLLHDRRDIHGFVRERIHAFERSSNKIYCEMKSKIKIL